MTTGLRSVAAALGVAAEVAADDLAVVVGDRELTHAQLHERAARLAGALAGRGIGPGDVVAVGLHNGAEYLETVLAAFRLGAVPVNVNYRYREPELRYALEYTSAAALVVDESLADVARAVVADLPGVRVLLQVGTEAYASAVAGPALPADDAERGDGIILLTGGTTGRPKGVVWDRDGLLGILSSVFRLHGIPAPTSLAEVAAGVTELGRRGDRPVVVPMSPMMHGTGFFNAMRTLLGGGTVCFATSRSLDAHEVWGIVARRRATEMVIVGDAFGRPLVDALADAEQAGTPYDIGCLRRITSSGVTWSVAVKRELLARGAMTLVDNISASEGGPFGISEVSRVEDLAEGRFTLASVARVLDEEDRDVVPGSGQVGVLASAGPQPVGYLGDPVRTARTWRVIDGVRHAVPGDLATVEADGRLVLLGRGDGVVNTGGEKVFPEEVEQALLAHPAITDAVVVGVPDPRWGQIVTALVAPRAALQGLTDAELTAHLGERLARYKHPRRLVRVDEVPRTTAGKANRARAREIATGQPFTVESGHVRAFARALGDAGPGIPPTFPIAFAHVDEDWPLVMRPGRPWHGSGAGPGESRGSGGLHAEQEFTYHRPLGEGETLTAHKRAGRTWTKAGRSGVLTFTERHIDFLDAQQQPVVRSTTVTVTTAPTQTPASEEAP
ncbi:AMP-binding protein [Pseudonocardia sp. CA-107938]|uniref:AMP-binding protein n=1 Tax=Pseudonocardia sp. CA-107938 TaxID=3240021 RepID=UPI003D8F8DBC